MNNNKIEDWSEIKPSTNILNFKFREILDYKDLIHLFVLRDFISEYKQTILGPLWFIIKPVMVTLIFTFVFGKVGKLNTSGINPFLFYFSGILTWKYFEDCVKKTSNTFISNSNIFGKVYFPRLAVPISIVISSCLSLLIQLIIFILILAFYYFQGSIINLQVNIILLIPAIVFLIIVMAMLGLGLGILISSLTTKYRDLRYLLDFGIQLMMYVSPVIIPITEANNHNYIKYLVRLNPMTGIIETFRFLFFGGDFYLYDLTYSFVFTVVIFLFGVIVFNKVERDFMDTI